MWLLLLLKNGGGLTDKKVIKANREGMRMQLDPNGKQGVEDRLNRLSKERLVNIRQGTPVIDGGCFVSVANQVSLGGV